MRDKFTEDFVFLPMDKNGGEMVCMCSKLYFSRTMSIYHDTSLFQVLHRCDSYEDTMQMAGYIMKCDADQKRRVS